MLNGCAYILTVDVGNTFIRFGLFAEDSAAAQECPLATCEITTPSSITADEARMRLAQVMGALAIDAGMPGVLVPAAAVLSCVVPALERPWKAALSRTCTGRVLTVGPGLKTGMPVHYDDPAEIGPDRKPIPGTEMEFDVDTILLSVGLIPENELTRQAGIAMDPHTKGAVVYENMETEIPGVFACGNVVHVHDLVDFVSGESETAGAAAAAYVQNGKIKTETVLPLAAGEGIGYTVPQHIRLDGVQKSVSVSFRVRRNYGPSTITVRCGPNKIAAFKRERLAPGEMEHITLPKALLQKADGPLIVAVEEVTQS